MKHLANALRHARDIFRNIRILRAVSLTIASVVFVAAFLLMSHRVEATSKFWIASAPGNFSIDANWSLSSGGSPDTSAPGAGDVALFDGNGLGNCTITVDPNAAGINIGSGYAGMITQAGGATLTLESYTQSGGTFTGGSGDIDINGTFTLSGGMFTASSNTSSIEKFASGGGAFLHNGGTVVLDGNADIDHDFNPAVTFNNLTFNKSNGKTSFLNGTVIVAGTMTLSDGFASNGTIEAQGPVNVGSNFDGGNAQLTFTGAVDQIFTNNGGVNLSGAWNINKSSGKVTLVSDLALGTSPLNIISGTLDLRPSFNLTADAISQSGGTFTGGSGVIDINGDFILSGGTFTASSGSTFFAKRFKRDPGGAFLHNGGTVVFDGNASVDQTLNPAVTFNNLTFNKSGGEASFLGGTAIVVGTLALSDGQAINGTIEAQGPVNVGPDFDGGNTALTFSGAVDQTFTNTGGVNPSGTWTVNKTGGAVTLASDLTLDTGVSLNVTSGMLNQVASFSLTAGTITAGAGGVLRNYGTGDLTIGNSVSNAGLIDLDGGGPNCGDADSILIRSSSPGTQRTWSVSGTGKFRLQDVEVQDQAGTAAITVFSGTDHPPGGTNGANWTFGGGCAPTEVTLESFTATVYEEGQVLLQWRTGFEVDNLGFNVYREEGGRQIRINPSLLAGSALVTGLNTRLTAGWSYSWLDKSPGDKRSAEYWLEDVDLKGQSTLHGPIRSQRSEVRGQKSEVKPQSATLSEIGNRESPDTSLPLERKAQPAELTAESIQAQAALALQPAAKIAVKREGWYRITQAQLDAAGFNTKVDPRLLQLFVDGSELPIIVSGEQDGRFDSTDAIEFYGVGLDSPYTDSRVYWLVAGNQAGLRVKQAKTDGTPASSQSFTATVERRDRTIYFSGLRNGEKENFFGAVIAREPVYQQLTLSHLARADSSDNQLEITLQGVTVTDHRVSVELNGAHIGEVVFNGQSQGTARFNVSNSLLREGNNVVQLAPLAGGSDVSLVDYLRISYQHSYSADNDALKLTGPGRQQVTIDGFTSKSVRVFDVTDPNSPQELIGEIEQQALGYAATFASPREGQRVFIALTNEQPPASVTLNQPSSLHKGKASFIIITRRELADSLKPLVALRERQGLRVALVDIEDIYDEFSFGQKTPFAVRDFLAFAKSNWKKKPRFVLFAGDASHDPKNYLGFGDFDFVSTKLIDTDFMETSSDDWFSDFDGDGIADLATGRLPARTAEELSSMVAKIIGYEQSGPADEVLLVADANDGFNFEQASSDLLSLIPPSLRITQVNRGRLDPEMARRSLFEALYRKQFLVNYVGHGSVNQWRANLLTNDDALALGNEHLPIFVMMTCLNDYFADPALDSLGEALMKAERGGAIAVWASSGMTMPRDQALLNQELYRLLFNRGQSITIGEAVMRVKNSLSSSDVRRTWILLGDPTMKLK